MSFVQARRQEALDDLDRLFDTVKREKGSIDVLWASAGVGEPAVLGEITEEQFERSFSLNARGTLEPLRGEQSRWEAWALGWEPAQPGLLADLDNGHYFPSTDVPAI